MARLNLLNLNSGARTHGGAPAQNISPELQLRRSVLARRPWEGQFLGAPRALFQAGGIQRDFWAFFVTADGGKFLLSSGDVASRTWVYITSSISSDFVCAIRASQKRTA
jgi:hypothetical protein